MKKYVKIPLIVVGSLAALFIVIATIISPIAHWYIEKNAQKICGRSITMEKLRINIFTGKAKIINFKMLESNNVDAFVLFQELSINVNLHRLLVKEFSLEELSLIKPIVPILQDSSSFNFSDLIERFSDDDTTSSDWAIHLKNISLQEGRLIYCDLQKNSKFDLKDISVKIPNIYLGNKSTDVGLSLNFDEGGKLNLQLKYSIKAKNYSLKLHLEEFAINSTMPYLLDYLNLQNVQGKLFCQLELQGNTDHIMDVVGKGDISIADFQAVNSLQENFATIDNFSATIANLDIPNRKLILESILLDGFTSSLSLYKTGGNTFSALSYETEEEKIEEEKVIEKKKERKTKKQKKQAAQEAAFEQEQLFFDSLEGKENQQPFEIGINKIICHHGAFTFNDSTLVNPFSMTIKDISLDGANLNSKQYSKLKLSAVLPQGGSIAIHWQGYLTSMLSHRLNVSLTNFNLQEINPLSKHYLGYPFQSGIFSFTSVNTITNAELNSHNKIDIYKCDVGKKIKGTKPVYKIPLKAGLFALRDRSGNIKLEIPVSGNIKEPTFSLKKIIGYAIKNIFIKVLASPIDLFTNNLGLKPEDFKDISYDLSVPEFSSEQYAQLNNIAQALKKDKNIHLEIRHYAPLEKTSREIALFYTKRDYYLSKNNRQTTDKLGIDDIEQIKAVKDTDKGFLTYVDKEQANRNLVADSLYQEIMILQRKEKMEAAAARFISEKEQHLLNFFTEKHSIESSKITLVATQDKKEESKDDKNIFSFVVQYIDEDKLEEEE